MLAGRWEKLDGSAALMPWADASELYKALGGAVALGLLLGGVVAILNSWRA